MKLFRCLALWFVCSGAWAQQTPALPQAPASVVAPGVSTLRPEFAPAEVAPRTTAIVEGFGAPNELRDMLRAQSEAIRMLAAKVDAMELQLRRIEGKLR